MGFINKSSSTTTNVEHKYYDQRSVVDAGGGIVGIGNRWDQSTHLTDARDQSDRSIRIDASTDGGAFDVVKHVADDTFDLAQRAQSDAASFNAAAANRSFDLASSSSAQAYKSNADALGFARGSFGDVLDLAKSVVGQAGTQAKDAAATVTSAYQAAADTATGNKTLIYVAIGAVALVGVAFAFKG
jgi:hypothetical protein